MNNKAEMLLLLNEAGCFFLKIKIQYLFLPNWFSEFMLCSSQLLQLSSMLPKSSRKQVSCYSYVALNKYVPWEPPMYVHM